MNPLGSRRLCLISCWRQSIVLMSKWRQCYDLRFQFLFPVHFSMCRTFLSLPGPSSPTGHAPLCSPALINRHNETNIILTSDRTTSKEKIREEHQHCLDRQYETSLVCFVWAQFRKWVQCLFTTVVILNSIVSLNYQSKG